MNFLVFWWSNTLFLFLNGWIWNICTSNPFRLYKLCVGNVLFQWYNWSNGTHCTFRWLPESLDSLYVEYVEKATSCSILGFFFDVSCLVTEFSVWHFWHLLTKRRVWDGTTWGLKRAGTFKKFPNCLKCLASSNRFHWGKNSK